MPKKKKKDQNKIFLLRYNGATYEEILSAYDVSKRTLTNWFNSKDWFDFKSNIEYMLQQSGKKERKEKKLIAKYIKDDDFKPKEEKKLEVVETMEKTSEINAKGNQSLSTLISNLSVIINRCMVNRTDEDLRQIESLSRSLKNLADANTKITQTNETLMIIKEDK